MSLFAAIRSAAPSGADVAFFLRALLTRPGDAPGILRREAARRRAAAMGGARVDPAGLGWLIDAWEASLSGGAFCCPPGAGPAISLAPPLDQSAAASALQTASAVTFVGAEADVSFAPLSLEAARLSLPQAASDPKAVQKVRAAWVETAAVSPALRAALHELAQQPIAPA